MTGLADNADSSTSLANIKTWKIKSRLCCIERSINRAYSQFITTHPGLAIGIILALGVITGLSGITLNQLPDFSDPAKGFYARGENTMTGRMLVFLAVQNRVARDLGTDIKLPEISRNPSSDVCLGETYIETMNDDECAIGYADRPSIPKREIIEILNSSKADNYCAVKVEQLRFLVGNEMLGEKANESTSLGNQSIYPVDIQRFYQFYFAPSYSEAVDIVGAIKWTCRFGLELQQVIGESNSDGPRSIGSSAASYFGTTCRNLTETQIEHFSTIVRNCARFHQTPIPRLIAENLLELDNRHLCESACFQTPVYEIFEYFTVFAQPAHVSIAAIWFQPKRAGLDSDIAQTYATMPFQPSDQQKAVHHQSFIHLARVNKWFTQNSFSLKSRPLKLQGVNMANNRLYTAMQQVKKDMAFTALAVFLTLTVSLLYTGNLFICLATVLNVVLSMSCAYTVYRTFLQIELFPYINLAGTFLLIGLSCDNAFVYMDIWRKGTKDQVRGHAVRHATAALFATSATTSAAFFTNMLSQVIYLRFFGLYLGLCVVFLFMFSVTIIPAILVIAQQQQQQQNKSYLKSNSAIALKSKLDQRLHNISKIIFKQLLPSLIIRGRYLIAILFTVFGICGLIAVFVYPRMRAAESIMAQRFFSQHLSENFEFELKPRIAAYRNLIAKQTKNPVFYFLYGVEETDKAPYLKPDNQAQARFIVESANSGKHPLLNDETLDLVQNVLVNRFFGSDLFANGHDIQTHWNFIKFAMGLSEFETNLATSIETVLANANKSSSTLNLNVQPLPYRKAGNELGVGGLLFRAEANAIFDNYENSFEFVKRVEQTYADLNISDHLLKRGFYVCPALIPYDLQRLVISGTYQSVPVSIIIVAIALLITTGIKNVIVTFFAIASITFTLAETIAVFVLMGWRVNVMESIIMITAVGLSVDFTVHYGVALLHSEDVLTDAEPCESPNFSESNELKMLDVDVVRTNRSESEDKSEAPVRSALYQVGVAVFMAAFTTFLAGLSLSPSSLMSFSQMGLFLMVIMMTSWANATFFFLSMCSIASNLIFRTSDYRRRLKVSLLKHCKCSRSEKTSEESGNA